MAATVMVIDDDRDFLELLVAILSPEGYNVVPCAEPACVLSTALQLRPEIVVVDLLMPGLSGWQVIDQLMEALSPRPRVIVCTAAVSEATQHIDQLRQWGCNVLLKPFELDDLLAVLSSNIRHYRAS